MESRKEFAQINWTIENPNEDSFLFKSVATLFDFKKRSCPVCDKLFATKLNRDKHMAKFHRQGQENDDDAADRTCPQCGQIFASEENRDRHVVRMHNQNRANVANNSTRVNDHQNNMDLENRGEIQALTNEINELKAMINDLQNERKVVNRVAIVERSKFPANFKFRTYPARVSKFAFFIVFSCIRKFIP